MRRLSATEAFTPAFEHTKAMLRPFSIRLWLKLGLVAFAAEMGGQFIVPPFGNFGTTSQPQTSGIGAVAGGVTPQMIAIFAIAGVAILLFGLAFLYLGSRMQFVLMDMVAHRSTLVTPAWRKHGSKTWRWIGLKVASFTAIFVVSAVLLAGPLIHLFGSMSTGSPQQLSPNFFGTFILLFGAIFVVSIVMMVIIWTIRDFVLPFIVFEDAGIGTALKRANALIRLEVPNVLFYFLLKFAFSMAAGIAAELCIIAALLIIAIPTGLIGGGIWMTLRHAGAFGTVFMYVSFVLLGMIAVALLVIAFICVIGATLIFTQAYALYFVGGRISPLGDLLEPPPPPLMEVPPPPLTSY